MPDLPAWSKVLTFLLCPGALAPGQGPTPTAPPSNLEHSFRDMLRDAEGPIEASFRDPGQQGPPPAGWLAEGLST